MRIQVIARAVLCGLCFTGVGVLLGSFRHVSMASVKEAAAALPVLGVGIGLLLVLRRTTRKPSVVSWLAGDEAGEADSFDPGMTAGALRLAAVSAGLLLLTLFMGGIWETANLAVFFFSHGRTFFQSIVEGSYLTTLDLALAGLRNLIYPVALCGWIVYLLTGAEALVRSATHPTRKDTLKEED